MTRVVGYLRVNAGQQAVGGLSASRARLEAHALAMDLEIVWVDDARSTRDAPAQAAVQGARESNWYAVDLGGGEVRVAFWCASWRDSPDPWLYRVTNGGPIFYFDEHGRRDETKEYSAVIRRGTVDDVALRCTSKACLERVQYPVLSLGEARRL